MQQAHRQRKRYKTRQDVENWMAIIGCTSANEIKLDFLQAVIKYTHSLQFLPFYACICADVTISVGKSVVATEIST